MVLRHSIVASLIFLPFELPFLCAVTRVAVFPRLPDESVGRLRGFALVAAPDVAPLSVPFGVHRIAAFVGRPLVLPGLFAIALIAINP